MIATGVDLVVIDRIATTLARHGDRFLRRIYTDAEVAYCNGRASALAARFAAKEAAAKALGTGIGQVAWREIEVVNAPNGQPSLRLHGAAAALAETLGLRDLSLSISHEHHLAVAFVVGMG